MSDKNWRPRKKKRDKPLSTQPAVAQKVNLEKPMQSGGFMKAQTQDITKMLAEVKREVVSPIAVPKELTQVSTYTNDPAMLSGNMELSKYNSQLPRDTPRVANSPNVSNPEVGNLADPVVTPPVQPMAPMGDTGMPRQGGDQPRPSAEGQMPQQGQTPPLPAAPRSQDGTQSLQSKQTQEGQRFQQERQAAQPITLSAPLPQQTAQAIPSPQGVPPTQAQVMRESVIQPPKPMAEQASLMKPWPTDSLGRNKYSMGVQEGPYVPKNGGTY